MTIDERVLGGLWGAVVVDALGVPVEFKGREARRRDPVTGMRGYGTFNVPPGTWSDDSSLLLCTAEALIDGFDLKRIADLFTRWFYKAHWTPEGLVFDVGNATRESIERLARGTSPEQAGAADERSNGNGSLMRILPVALRFAQSPPDELLEYLHFASCLTHRHPRSQMACGFYGLMVAGLLEGKNPADAYRHAVHSLATLCNESPYKNELSHFDRILNGNLAELDESDIRSGGYVIDTLEASIWCLLTTSSFTEAVLKAVNLGDDTDTTGCVTGGLAGIWYGLSAVREDWLSAIARRGDIGELFARYLPIAAMKIADSFEYEFKSEELRLLYDQWRTGRVRLFRREKP